MWNKILNNCSVFSEKDAFVIKGIHYTYDDIRFIAGRIQQFFMTSEIKNKIIGIYLDDDIFTYCSMIASLCSGIGYVPLNPSNPADRNLNIIQQADIGMVLYSNTDSEFEKLIGLSEDHIHFVHSNTFNNIKGSLKFNEFDKNQIAYILFTSGSTGIPKGVPITHSNLEAFLNAFFAMDLSLSNEDRFLQMFDLTFDLSVISYLPPLLIGASVHTVPHDGVKYMQVYSTLENEKVTFAMMVPSMLSYLRPYFEDLKFESLKYSFFCGEALYEDIINEWHNCVPNAHIYNVYGPTEDTVVCMEYNCTPGFKSLKSYNGIISIGRPMKDTSLVILKEDGSLAKVNEKGELCLSGPQLTTGYIRNEEKNREVFFWHEGKRFYKTGDICFYDKDGDYFYCGRIDHQVKIDGYRIELSEVEHHVRTCLTHQGVVVLDRKKENGSTVLHLFIENYQQNVEDFLKLLQEKLPDYMIPKEFTQIPSFPLNSNGKVDRKKLRSMIV